MYKLLTKRKKKCIHVLYYATFANWCTLFHKDNVNYYRNFLDRYYIHRNNIIDCINYGKNLFH